LTKYKHRVFWKNQEILFSGKQRLKFQDSPYHEFKAESEETLRGEKQIL